MMVEVAPGTLRGSLEAPPSKSYTHRALLAAASMDRPLALRHPLRSDDTLRTVEGLRRLGYPIRTGPDVWTVGRREPHRVGPRRRVRIDCGESGTTLRFLLPLAARDPGPTEFVGSPRLGARPIDELADSLRAAGASVVRPSPGGWPIVVRGPLRAGAVAIRADRSSQFVSALLLTLAGVPSRSVLTPIGRSVSRPYIASTVRVLEQFGATVRRAGRGWTVGGGHASGPIHWTVPGDASSAAYWWAAAAVTAGDVRVSGIPPEWPQADLAVLDLLRAAGARVDTTGRSTRLRGPIPRGCVATLDDAPDLFPLVVTVGAVRPVRSEVRGAVHAAWKESDRRASALGLGRALGAAVIPGRARWRIRGTARPRALAGYRSTDHRLVASAAVGALCGDGPSRIGEAEALRKSYPGFWRDLRRLGGVVRSVR